MGNARTSLDLNQDIFEVIIITIITQTEYPFTNAMVMLTMKIDHHHLQIDEITTQVDTIIIIISLIIHITAIVEVIIIVLEMIHDLCKHLCNSSLVYFKAMFFSNFELTLGALIFCIGAIQKVRSSNFVTFLTPPPPPLFVSVRFEAPSPLYVRFFFQNLRPPPPP